MRNPEAILTGLETLGSQLRGINDRMSALAREQAAAERDYRVALAKRILELKDAGMSVTLIGDIARGDEAIAALKLKRDTAAALLSVAQDEARNKREGIQASRSQLAWLKAELTET